MYYSISGYVGSLIAMCDVFYSLGNIMDLVVVRCLFVDIMNWSITFQVTIILSIACSILFLLFGSSQQQCWDQRYIRPWTRIIFRSSCLRRQNIITEFNDLRVYKQFYKMYFYFNEIIPIVPLLLLFFLYHTPNIIYYYIIY